MNHLSPSSVQHKDGIKTLPPSEKQINITLITKEIQTRNLKKKENESDTVDSSRIINLLKTIDNPDERKKDKNIIGQKTDTNSDIPKLSSLKKVHAIVKEQKVIKPSAISKDQKSTDIDDKEQKNIAQKSNEDIAKKKAFFSNGQGIQKNTEKTNMAERKKTNGEVKENKMVDKTTTQNGNTRWLKKTESNCTISKNEHPIDRTQGTKNCKAKQKLDRTQSEVSKLKKDFEPSKSLKGGKEHFANKTYLELETLKNINLKANEKSPPPPSPPQQQQQKQQQQQQQQQQVDDKLLNGKKMHPQQRSIGNIENVSVKRYQRIETSEYFNYKKSPDDVRTKDEIEQITDKEKNKPIDLFKSKADVLKDARTRERSNAKTKPDGKPNIMYVPYAAAKNRDTDNIPPPTGNCRSKNLGARSNEASLVPRFKGTTSSTGTTSVVTKSNIVKPSSSFSSRVFDRFIPRSNAMGMETKRINTIPRS